MIVYQHDHHLFFYMFLLMFLLLYNYTYLFLVICCFTHVVLPDYWIWPFCSTQSSDPIPSVWLLWWGSLNTLLPTHLLLLLLLSLLFLFSAFLFLHLFHFLCFLLLKLVKRTFDESNVTLEHLFSAKQITQLAEELLDLVSEQDSYSSYLVLVLLYSVDPLLVTGE